MAVSAPSPLRWSREAFYALCETGLLGDQRVELIEGEIIEMPPPGPRHVKLVRFLFRLISSLAPEGTFVAKEDPFDLPRTVVVPDVLVLKGDLWSYDELNPSTALLAIEVEMDADRHTLARKASLYAEAEIPEYLLVDVARSRVIQFRDPEWDGYRTRTEYRVGEFLTILGKTLDARVFLSPQPEDLL